MGCHVGVEEVASSVRAFKGLLSSLKVTLTECWADEDDEFLYASGGWVDALECNGGPKKMYQLRGRVFVVYEKATKKIKKEVDIIEGDHFGEVFAECAGNVPNNLFVGPIDKEHLTKVAEQDRRRWLAILGPERIDSEEEAILKAYTTDDFVFCATGYGCHDRAATGALFKAFRSSVESIDLEYDMNNLWFAPNEVGIKWTAAYKCPHGGPGMSMSGLIHILLDGDLYKQYYDSFDSKSLKKQLADCAARGGPDQSSSPEL